METNKRNGDPKSRESIFAPISDRRVCADDSLDPDTYSDGAAVARAVADNFKKALASQTIKRK